MRKSLTALLITLCLVLGFSVSASAASAVDVAIDGKSVAFTTQSGSPFIDRQNRTLVPLRVTMETYGCSVYWDNENQNAIVYKDGVTVVCPIDKSYIEVNGKRVKIDTAAVIKNSRTYLPIRSVLEAMGADVGWQSVPATVRVTRGETGSSHNQDSYIERALAAIDANKNLSAEAAIEVRAAVRGLLKAIPVTEAQISKICTRLQTLQVKIGGTGKCAGLATSVGNQHTISILPAIWDSNMLLRSINPNAIDGTMVHELNHVYSQLPSADWFQEGMNSVINNDVCVRYNTTDYEAYERVCLLVTEICGADAMLTNFFTGDETPLCNIINRYAGISDSKTRLNHLSKIMQNAFDNGYYANSETDKQAYLAAAAELTELFEKAYKGKTGLDIHDDALCEVYLTWLNTWGSLFRIKVEGDFTFSAQTPPFYFNPANYHSVLVIKDKNHKMSADGEFMYYRY